MNLYCWAHVPDQLSHWTAAWLERIKNLYTAHEQLSVAWASGAAAELEHACTAWDDALGVIDAERTKPLQAAKKALATLDREWDGLVAHRDYPMISLDNNAAERALRRPVVTRKNAYGSRTEDAARLAARIWTITATAEMAGLNPITYLTPTSTPADEPAASPRPVRTSNGSCPGPPPAKTCTRGHSHPAPADTPTDPVTASPRRNGHAAPRHALHGTSEYLPPTSLNPQSSCRSSSPLSPLAPRLWRRSRPWHCQSTQFERLTGGRCCLRPHT